MSEWERIVENILKENDIILDEAKQVGLLYHNTPDLEWILKSNTLKGNFSVGISFDKHEGWFNDRGWHLNSYYTLILDGDKLSNNYKIIETNRSKGEILVIPPHQEIKTYKKELDKIIEYLTAYRIPNEDIEKYLYFKNDRNKTKWNEQAREKFIKNFQKKYFDLQKPGDSYDWSRFNNLIYDYYRQLNKGEYSSDLETPLIINNLKLRIHNINKNIKMFKGMYPNLPVYLRDDKGHKALLKKTKIDQLPEIKTVNYPLRSLNKIYKD